MFDTRTSAFFIYINDLTENLHSDLRMLAKDNSLFITINDPTTTANQFCENFYKIKEWDF